MRGGDNRPENIKKKPESQGYTILDEVPDPPEYLTDRAKEVFREKAAELIKAKQMQEVDIDILGTLAANIAMFEMMYRETLDKGYFDFGTNGMAYTPAWVKQMKDCDKRISQLSAYFGFSPLHRQKIGIETGKISKAKKDMAARLLKMKKAN